MDPTLVTGEGAGGAFVAAAAGALADAVGFHPYHGTFNLAGADVEDLPARTVEEVGDERCDGVGIRDCRVAGVRAAVVRPFVPDYPPDKTEVLAPVGLRALFGFDDGDPVPFGPPHEVWPPASRRADPAALDGFDAVVFDLDGTLVDLDVDWAAVRAEIDAAVGDRLDGPSSARGPPDLYRAARAAGVYDELSAVLRSHELEGAERAAPRPPVEWLAGLDAPVGVCTANDAEAAERALEGFGLRDAVDVVVGRDTLREHKPAPEPLASCLDALGARPGNAVFVGDMAVDAGTARRAGTSFLAADQLASG